jgi:SAM-dependent MidA family methyltransferase
MAHAEPTDGPAGPEIRAAIEAAGGAIPFDEFMRIALYGTRGFYSRPADEEGGSAGRRGDFITSPEVGPLFGAVVARFLDDEWRRLGRPDTFTVVDAGAGPGTLARTVLAARPACIESLRYMAVEISTVQRDRHPDGVESVGEFPDEAFDGVVLANELLDNLPFRLAVYDGGWREAYVVDRGDGTFGEMLSAPFDPLPSVLPTRAAHGSRAPIHTDAVEWFARMQSLVRSGSMVVIDYAAPTTASLAGRPYREWLRTYRGHERGDHPLRAPGSQDITTEVALDQFPAADAVRSQTQWLQLWGIDDLVAEGKRVWTEQSARPGLEAMRMRSRVSESEALVDPAGLGAFTVAQWQTR